MKEVSSDYREWEVGGLVIGPFLPKGPFVLAGVTFTNVSDPYVADIIGHRRPIGLKMRANVPHVQWSPPSLSVSSSHAVRVVVRARDENMAMKLGIERIETACICLAVAANAVAYDFELTGVVPVGESARSTPFSHIAWIRLWKPRALSVSIAEQATRIARVAKEDPVVCSSIAYLREAKSLMAIRSIAPVSKSIFLNFFKVIEVVSDRVARDWRCEHAEELERKSLNVVGKLYQTLSALGGERLENTMRKNGDPVSEVRKAAIELQKLQELYQADEIKRAAESLGVGADVKEIASDMSSLRNRIAHPGRADQKKLRSLLEPLSPKEQICPSERAARAFLTAYIRQVG